MLRGNAQMLEAIENESRGVIIPNLAYNRCMSAKFRETLCNVTRRSRRENVS
jgi:hypothetical protein